MAQVYECNTCHEMKPEHRKGQCLECWETQQEEIEVAEDMKFLRKLRLGMLKYE